MVTRPRGRPARGQGVTRDHILAAALSLLDEGGGQGLTMRALAARLGVTAMSLYHHVLDRQGLLVALSDLIYGEVLQDAADLADPAAEIRALLIRYHDAVGRHPQLTLAIFAEPAAFAGVSRQITARLGTLLSAYMSEHILWRDILIDHAHGSGLALLAAQKNPPLSASMREQYQQALDCMLTCALPKEKS